MLVAIALLVATSAGATENGKATESTHSSELLSKVKELSALQNTYNGEYAASIWFAGLLDTPAKRVVEIALKDVDSGIPHLLAKEYLTCNATVDCSKRDANLDMAITAYKRGLFRLSDKKEVFNSLKYPSMSDGFTNGYGTYVEGGNEINNDDIF